jgi:ribosomal protein S4
MRECADGLAREGTVRQIVRPEPDLGVCRQITRRMMERRIDNLHMAVWWGLASSQRRARRLILGP